MMAGADDWTVLGTAPAQIQDPWAVRATAPAPVAPAKNTSEKVGEAVLGPSEILGNALLSIPHAAAHAVLDLARRVTGQDTNAPDPAAIQAINPTLGDSGQRLENDIGNMLAPSGSDIASEIQTIRDKALGPQNATVGDVLHQAGQVGMDVASIAPVAGAVKAAAELPGQLAAKAAAKAADPFEQLGLKTSVDHPVARAVAGSSGREALGLQNQQVGNTVAGAQAGVAPGTPIDYKPLEDARAAPNAVYGRVAQSLPTGPLSPNAQAAIQAVGSGANRITAGSQTVQDTIQGLKDSLLNAHGNFSGDQVINESRGLRQEGGVGIASDDVDQQAIGAAKLQMAKALETHVVDSLPADAPVSLDQFQQARTALAKNYAVQSALKGNDVDLQGLGRIQRADPDLMTGDLQTLGDFANKHPEVSTLPSAGTRYSPPGLGKDLGSVNIINPRTWVQPLLGALARRSMTGAPGEALGAAAARPVTGLGGEFAPIDRTPQPPPGLTAGPMGAPAAPAGPPGQIPLADVLSHGVEQSPPAGLSLAPDASSGPSGIPFQRDAGHESGLLGLIDDFAGPSQTAPAKGDNRDLGAVMSSQVPEGTLQKTPQSSPQPMPDGGLAFRSPNGQTIVRQRGDTLQVSDSATNATSQGRGEGTQRMMDAYKFAQANGLNLVSDTKVSSSAAKIYDRLEKLGFDIKRNPADADENGNLLSSAGRPVFEVSGAPLGDEM